MVQKLEKQSISAIISESKVKNQTLYRVLLAKEFKKIEDARKYRDEVQKYSFVKELGLKDFWVCKSEKIISKQSSEPVAKPAPAPKKAAQPKTAPKKKTPQPQPKKEEPKPEPIPEPSVKNVEPEPTPAPEPVPEVPAPVKNVEPEPAPIIVVPVEEPKELVKNEKAVLSEKTPYSVLVRSYKFNQFAENDCNRLKELGFDAYLLNTFDDENFFAFNIHVGAFETIDEASVLKTQFTDAGIFDTEISNYNEIKPKIDRYDEIISGNKVVFDDGRADLPSGFTPAIEKLVKQFPANKDFQISELIILDYDNYRLNDDKPELDTRLINFIETEDSVHAALLATYRDELYRKDVTVYLVAADSFNFTDSILEPNEKLQLGSGNGSFDCNLYVKGTGVSVCGENISEKLFVQIESKDYSQEEFLSFLTDSFNENSLSLYPQLRKTLYVLPDATSTQRDFISFNLKKVGSDYASERGNASWAMNIVGHTLAKTFYVQKNSLFCIGFYDLDYDFNARSVHNFFMSTKNSSELSSNNQSVSVNGAEGWYLVNTTQKEISFSTKSYVIAIDADPASSLQREDLIQAAADLRIWNGNAIIDAK